MDVYCRLKILVGKSAREEKDGEGEGGVGYLGMR